MKDYVEVLVSDGKFSTYSDYVQHLIRADQERREAVAAIQSAIDEGIASGPAQRFDFDSFKTRMREQHDEES